MSKLLRTQESSAEASPVRCFLGLRDSSVNSTEPFLDTGTHTCAPTSETQEETQHRPPESPHPGPAEPRVTPLCLGLHEDGRRSVGSAQQDGKDEPAEVAESPAQSSSQEGRVGAEGALQPHQVPRQSRPLSGGRHHLLV